nr:hypothetical protein CFP56_24446 [Quercus suber]
MSRELRVKSGQAQIGKVGTVAPSWYLDSWSKSPQIISQIGATLHHHVARYLAGRPPSFGAESATVDTEVAMSRNAGSNALSCVVSRYNGFEYGYPSAGLSTLLNFRTQGRATSRTSLGTTAIGSAQPAKATL